MDNLNNLLQNDPNVSDKFKEGMRIDMDCPLEDAVEKRCDKCDAVLEYSDYELGHEFMSGGYWCQKCWDQSQDYLEDSQ